MRFHLALATCLLLGVGCPASPIGPSGGIGSGSDEGTGGEDDSGTGGETGDSGDGGDDTSTGTGGDDTGTGTGGDDTGDPPRAPPNVLLLIADDFGLDLAAFDSDNPCYDVGADGAQPEMPNVAALCQEGVRFERVWAQPTCSPTRASMLTGKSPWQHLVGGPLNPSIPDINPFELDSLTLPRALELSGSGYAAANIGKWHISLDADDPNDAGWPHYAGSYLGTLDSFDSWDYTENGETSVCEEYATTKNVDDALSFLDGLEGDPPWLLWVAFNAPHDPFHLPPAELHNQTELTEYADEDDARPWVVAMSEAMDSEIGRLLDGVRDRGEWDDTVVIFLGDNGTDKSAVADPVGSSKAKGTLWEGGSRVPMVVGGGAMVGGGRSVDHLVQVSDLNATILEIAGVDVDAVRLEHAPGEPYDSVSFAPVLWNAEAEGARSRVLVQGFSNGTTEPDRMRTAWTDGRHKVMCQKVSTKLFDLEADPWEDDDLLGDGEPSPEALEILEGFQEELGALFGVEEMCPYIPEDDTGSSD